jgi:hypothetical protein
MDAEEHEIYELHKKRETVEKMFDTYKTVLNAEEEINLRIFEVVSRLKQEVDGLYEELEILMNKKMVDCIFTRSATFLLRHSNHNTSCKLSFPRSLLTLLLVGPAWE